MYAVEIPLLSSFLYLFSEAGDGAFAGPVSGFKSGRLGGWATRSEDIAWREV